jgi:hypothetical protein
MTRRLRLRRPSHTTVVAYLALFAAVGTGGAYAANTIGSADIIDGEVKAADIGNNAVDSARVRDNTINTFDVHSFIGEDVIDGTLTGADVADTSSLGPNDIREESLLFGDTLLQSDLATDSVASDEVEDDSLTGADINESTLAVPPSYPPATIFSGGHVDLPDNNGFTQVATRTMPPGNYTVVATATFDGAARTGGGPDIRQVDCELRSQGSPLGQRAFDSREVPVGGSVRRQLPVLGVVVIPAGGADLSLFCSSITAAEFVDHSDIIASRVVNFF